ncbi:redox-sensitive transcriptional activator SoxR [Cognatishimia activa]|uniref:redox-sensitive transcriptional activator SoxR n=1 Tax=Cognatishimia activa TaxID=1715691 RepID=UPI0022304907|nr:redox-sensitive transcriptional activator SoxR [Cognatishimia activa]UZD92302.1 redox-sensitive transcriptional activator SoxR [Cognatishimia activa]
MQNRQITNRGLSIGQISDRTGLAPSAIRYYEDESLVAPFRNAGGQRRYERADIRRLSFIMIAQQLGFSIKQIKAALASLPDNRTPTKADWTRLSKQFRDDLEARIAQMEALRDKLDGCIGCGCLSLKACKLYNPQDRIKTKGHGPRYLMGNSIEEIM